MEKFTGPQRKAKQKKTKFSKIRLIFTKDKVLHLHVFHSVPTTKKVREYKVEIEFSRKPREQV